MFNRNFPTVAVFSVAVIMPITARPSRWEIWFPERLTPDPPGAQTSDFTCRLYQWGKIRRVGLRTKNVRESFWAEQGSEWSKGEAQMADIAADPASHGFKSIPEIDVLWITAGLGCDGDTIAMTAATQPSLEDIVLWRAPMDTQGPFPQSISRL